MAKISDILGPTPYTGESGDVWSLNHPTTHDDWNPSTDTKFVYAQGQFHVSDKDDYDVLMRNAGAGPDYEGPMAIGTIHIDYGKAEFQVFTNIHAKGIERVLQIVCDKQGWQFGGVTDMAGQTLSESKVSSIFFKEESGILKLAHSPSSLNKIDGAIHIQGKNAHVYPYCPPALRDWAQDSNMILLAGDNVIKTIEDLEEHNVYSPNWNDEEDHFLRKNPEDDPPPKGPFICSDCSKEFSSMNQLILHRKNDEDPWDDVQTRPPVIEYNPADGIPNMDATIPDHFKERPTLVYGAQPLPAPVPWIYDVKDDKVVMGMPGQTPDTMGAHPSFLPGQIIRGTYFPSGQKLEIGALTNVSISVAHLLELFRWQLPHLTIRSVWIDVGNGAKPERLAGSQESIWE